MPPKAQANPNPLGLTARETEIAVIAWKCLESDNKIDNTKLASMARIGKPASAARMWRTIKAKIEAAPAGTTDASNGAGDSPQTASTAATNNKKKAAAAKGGKKRTKNHVVSNDGANTDANESENSERPKKKVAKRVKEEVSEPAVESEDIDDAGEI